MSITEVAASPASYAQEGLWLLEQLGAAPAINNLPMAWRVGGAFDVDAFRAALRLVAERNPVLLTECAWDEGVGALVTRRVHHPQNIEVRHARRTAGLAFAELYREALRPFPPGIPPARAHVWSTGADRLLLMVFSHLVFDGGSEEPLLAELDRTYRHVTAGEHLGDTPPPFARFAHDQRERFARADQQDRVARTAARLPVPRPTRLPGTVTGPGGGDPAEGARHYARLEAPVLARLRELGRSRGASDVMVVLAGLAATAARLGGEEACSVLLPYSNRAASWARDVVGPCLNSLFVTSAVDPAKSFVELLDAVRDACLDAYGAHDVPAEALQARWAGSGARAHTNLMLNMFHRERPELRLPGCRSQRLTWEQVPVTARADLCVYAWPDRGGLRLEFLYRTAALREVDAASFAASMTGLLEAASREPDLRLGSLPLDGAEAAARALEASLPGTAYPSVVAQVWEAAARRPDAVAVAASGGDITYRELTAAADRAAGRLLGRGVRHGEVVAVLGDHDANTVLVALAVLRAGGVLLLVQPDLPDARRRALYAAARPVLVAGGDVSFAELLAEGPPDGPGDLAMPRPDDPSYVFFTSGSTGVPKGVLGRHGGLGHFLAWERELLGAAPGDRVGWRTNLGFDVVLRDLFLPLVSGATLVVPRAGDLDDAGATLRWLAREGVTVMHITPSLADVLVADRVEDPAGAPRPASLRAVLFAGEPLTASAVTRWREQMGTQARLLNLYGPTETTLAKCCFEVPAEPLPGVQPIGAPMPETQVVVVNGWGSLAGVGEPGELTIRTPHRSLGYLGVPDAREEARFVPNPRRHDPDDLLYRTGDLGRLRPDGLLDILGRADDQIKVHGVRLQPAEVAAALHAHVDVEQAVVRKREDGHGLVGYVVPRPGARLAEAEVLRHAAALLPPALVPSRLVELERMPLLPNGKVDKRSLPQPGPAAARAAATAPRNPCEAAVIEVFRDVLGVTSLGVDDGFVALGGHSLLAMRAAGRLRRRLGVRVPPATVLDPGTPALLAAWIAQQERTAADVAAPPSANPDAPYPAGLAQERMFFLEELTAREPGVYNIPWCFRFRGELDEAALQRALVRVAERHAPLRTGFEVTDGALLARPRPAADVLKIRTVDLSGPDELTGLVREELARRLDLRAGECLRAVIGRLGPQDRALVLVVHHIAADGWSLAVLQAELAAYYGLEAGRPRAVEPPPLASGYADFAVGQRERTATVEAGRALAQVVDHLRGAPERYGMPTDRPRGRRQTYRGDRVVVELPVDLPGRLRDGAARRAVTPFAAVAAALAAALAARGGDAEVVLGTPVANRHELAHDGLIGCFINTVPLRVALPESGRLDDLVTAAAAEASRALRDADVPFEQVLSALDVPRSVNHPAVFQAMLVMQECEPGALDLPGVRVTGVEDVRLTAKTDLSLIARLGGDRPALSVEYNADLFHPGTARRLAHHVLHLLERLASGQTAGRLDDVPPAEQADERAAAAGPRPHRDADEPLDLMAAIRRSAARTPHAGAVSFAGCTLSYSELVGLADAHGRRLRDAGVGAGDVVAVHLERSLELVVALLSVLAAGAAYLPLDTTAPAERLRVMMDAAGAEVLLTGPDGLPRDVRRPHVVTVDLDAPPQPALGVPVPPGAPAYCIFTSGSTGTPKGVLVSHAAILNRLRWMQDTYRLDPSDTVLQKTPYGFDVSVWEFFWPLLAGARIAVARPGGHRDPGYLLDEIRRERVTVLHFVPAMLAAFLGHPGASAAADSVRLVVCSGEALEAGLRDRFFAMMAGPGTPRLENLYGPTEAAVDVSRHSCRPTDGRTAVPIGRPIDNIELYVLDRNLGVTPRGGLGELYIGGVGLALGYVGRADLTADRFVPHPFASRSQPGARLYRTGDLVRRLEDGELEFLGRSDSQVKIRGHRIELGEIEERLTAEPGVADAVVVVREHPRGKALVAYAVLRPGAAVDEAGLDERLRAFLPDYMCPSAIVLLPELPLGATGKVDRRALPDPDEVRPRAAAFEAPATEPERVLADIWSDVLALSSAVSAHDNFFAVGGDSLSAVRVVGAAEDRGWSLALDEVFTARTLRALAAALTPAPASATAAAPAASFSMLNESDRALLGGLDTLTHDGGAR